MMLAARILGRRLPERVPGVELVQAVCHAAAIRGDRVFLLGGEPGVAKAAATAMSEAEPRLLVAGTLAGTPAEAGDEESLRAVRNSQADIVLVAFGAPGQELWSERNLAVSGATVAIGVGGTFDYLSGQVRRAPGWVRRIGLEWLYRLVRQPWRLRRQAVLPVFLLLVIRQRLFGN
jgi:N-acetylglucosaminyldiphosphoundecaprenol N-acetyl-beta-D-mannosaminyltransferase